jgi:hypothetical protein
LANWGGPVNGGFSSQDAQLQVLAEWIAAGYPEILGQAIERGAYTANSEYDVNAAISYLKNHLSDNQYGDGNCAKNVRLALAEAGINVVGTLHAKDLGQNLVNAGFTATKYTAGEAVAGDVAIIQGTARNPSGHAEVFTGTAWISDFTQNNFWPSRAYQSANPEYVIYRYGQ